MSRRYLPLLLVLTGLWGSSFLFIEIALDEIEPTTLMALRLLTALLALVPALVVRFGARAGFERLRLAWRQLFVLGLVNAAVPFTLVAWGQQHIDSGIAAIAISSVPIFVTLLALRYRPSERVTGVRALGIVVGLGGVAVLAGANPNGGWLAVAGTLAAVAAAFLYAVSSLYAQTHVESVDGLVLVTGSTLAGGLILALRCGVP